jgi:hypothetical protein
LVGSEKKYSNEHMRTIDTGKLRKLRKWGRNDFEVELTEEAPLVVA